MDPFDKPPSPIKNLAGGGGCGCGCLGLLLMLLAAVFVGALSMQYLHPTSAGTVYLSAGILTAVGLLLLVVGVLMWIFSVVID